jgi:hypothetical protein
MRPIVAAVVTLIAFSAVAAAGARDPREEQERLRPADTRAARASLIRLADLNTGWKRDKPSDDSDSDTCPHLSPDFSRFVITGKAKAEFMHPQGAWLISETEIYASRQHAVGDFALSARPWLVKCLRYTLEHAPAKDPRVRLRVLTARMVPTASIGEFTARIKALARVIGPARQLTMYVDFFAFVKGRSIGSVAAMSLSRPIRGGGTLARAMVDRM